MKKVQFLSCVCLAFVLSSCSSVNYGSFPVIVDNGKTHSGTYGSGPNHTQPYPQDQKVNLNGVGGAKVKYEPLSKGGNKNYTVLGKNYEVWRDCTSYQEIGTASWYGPGFHGKKTSNGEVYNQKAFTAAHKNLPLPSYLKVTNMENGQAVIVRVNDRGPFHGNRIIDLSESAADAIGIKKKGTGTVKLEYIDVRSGNTIANLANSALSGTTSTGSDSIRQVISDLNNGTKPSIGTTIAAGKTVIHAVDKLQSYTHKSTSYKSQGSKSLTTSTYADNIEDQLLNTANANNKSKKQINSNYYIQVFSSAYLKNAQKVQDELSGSVDYPVIIHQENNLYKVFIGPIEYNDKSNIIDQVEELGFSGSFLKTLNGIK